VHCPFVRSVGALQSLVAGRVVDATRLLVVLQYLCVPKYFLVDVMILSMLNKAVDLVNCQIQTTLLLQARQLSF